MASPIPRSSYHPAANPRIPSSVSSRRAEMAHNRGKIGRHRVGWRGVSARLIISSNGFGWRRLSLNLNEQPRKTVAALAASSHRSNAASPEEFLSRQSRNVLFPAKLKCPVLRELLGRRG